MLSDELSMAATLPYYTPISVEYSSQQKIILIDFLSSQVLSASVFKAEETWGTLILKYVFCIIMQHLHNVNSITM